ncbi:DeoR family transcriptional regulator [Xenorhabdus bovienii]|uniref:transcriptional repressor AgaR n=1 Tax=Xenorhabdus bovienii TaxID=40576 RepID=UPI0023B28931|nr:transcriptional repressor AgaR [Xenorhabdus bovienii]MDE9431507.1 DeoR family transcriptional regulator [Xenorhabdus bovienii]MDE9459534.1 DeoR family transcriptional regulator [Xenorhabdus bovienii]MDE9489055.1 DeoR family transcriptional regulator [Xenorhabdus bovienii]MDE9495141.1 DeoR family transcriptional regulator [Xenorhabdus bovienii]MDE9503534.1 DeoR family transcriptional regulator [Xenorhabdus bovienii]
MSTDTVKRREAIIDQLCEEGSVKVKALSQHFGVSSVTIRNDLSYLEKKGCVLRSYGGAMVNHRFAFDRPLQVKGRMDRDIKTHIAAKAAEFVKDGDYLIIDSGSTTAEIVPLLRDRRDLVVMTNALNIAYELAAFDNIDVMVLGGNVRKNSYSLYGQAAEQQLYHYRFDTLFLGVDGFDLEAGITTPHQGEAHLNRVMCDVAHQIIAVTDGSKFGRKSFCLIREARQIHRLITDSRIPESYRKALTEFGVDVIIVDE